MTDPVFYVGELPSDPFIITVLDPDGTARDLTPYDSVEIEGFGPGASNINNAPLGKVQYTFDEAFDEAGVLSVRVRMEVGTDVDYSDPFDVVVKDPDSPGTFTLLTPSQAEAITGTPVSDADLLGAQGFIALVVDRDLSDTDVVAALSTADLRRLRQAVAWQSSAGRSPALGIAVPAGAGSVSTGDLSISFGAQGASAMDDLHSYAQLAIRRLSWMGSRAIHLRPARSGAPYVDPLVSDAHAWNRL